MTAHVLAHAATHFMQTATNRLKGQELIAVGLIRNSFPDRAMEHGMLMNRAEHSIRFCVLQGQPPKWKWM